GDLPRLPAGTRHPFCGAHRRRRRPQPLDLRRTGPARRLPGHRTGPTGGGRRRPGRCAPAQHRDAAGGDLRTVSAGALPVYALPAHRPSELIHLARTAEAIALVTSDTHAGFDCRPMADRVRSESPSLKHVLVAGDPGKDSDGFTALETLRDEPERAALADPDPGTVAFFQLSGGTTGLPKLIPRTHDDYLYSVRASADICALDTDTVYLGAMPITHNFPMSSPGFLGVLHAGGTVVLAPDPSPDTALALVEREHITHTAVVPPVAMLWLDAVEHGPQNHRDLSSLRVLQVGGATFAEEAARRVTPVLGCALQQVFGMAE